MFALVIASIMLAFGMLSADVPNLIDFQGRITDSSENPINGPVGITFAVYEVQPEELYSGRKLKIRFMFPMDCFMYCWER